MKKSDVLKIFLWEGLNLWLLRRKRKKRYQLPANCHGINIGCGLHNPKLWKGVDGGATHYIAKKLPGFLLKSFYRGFNMHKNYSFEEYTKLISELDFVHHELLFGLPFDDGSVPNVYSSHFFEHLHYQDALKLLTECRRVLATGGRIRICVPSLESEVEKIRSAVAAYDSGDSNPIQNYVTWNKSGYQSYYSNHHWMYNHQGLRKILEEAGFTDIIECSYHQGLIQDVDVLDTRKGIYMEAVKR